MPVNKLQKAEKMLGQCECGAVKFIYSGNTHWQKSICKLPKLPPMECYGCSQQRRDDEAATAKVLDNAKEVS